MVTRTTYIVRVYALVDNNIVFVAEGVPFTGNVQEFEFTKYMTH